MSQKLPCRPSHSNEPEDMQELTGEYRTQLAICFNPSESVVRNSGVPRLPDITQRLSRKWSVPVLANLSHQVFVQILLTQLSGLATTMTIIDTKKRLVVQDF